MVYEGTREIIINFLMIPSLIKNKHSIHFKQNDKYYNINGPYSVYYYINGNKANETWDKTHKYRPAYTGYYDNGNKKFETWYENRETNGEMNESNDLCDNGPEIREYLYNIYGIKTEECFYNHSKLVKLKKYEYSHNQIVTVNEYSNDNHGEMIKTKEYYYENGELIKTKEYENGELIKMKDYKTGNIKQWFTTIYEKLFSIIF